MNDVRKLRSQLYDLATWMTTRIREGYSAHSTQDLHNVVSAFFILQPPSYSSGRALDAGFSNNPDDVAEPGLLSRPSKPSGIDGPTALDKGQ